MTRRGRSVLWLASSLACVSALPAQSSRTARLATGRILVASRDLSDPNFARTVVLLVKYGDDGVVGLILNRRSSISVSRVLPMKEAGKRSEPVYLGGPVERTGVLSLLRSSKPVEDGSKVLRDVYAISTRPLLTRTLASDAGPDAFRVYLGYAGWNAGQLEQEVELGGWFVFPGASAQVFDADPASLWSRLIASTEGRFAAEPWQNGRRHERAALDDRAYALR